MVRARTECFYLCTGPMQSDWFPRNGESSMESSTIGANIGTAVLAPIMTVLLTMAEYKDKPSVFAVAAIALGIFAYATLRDDPIEAGMYPDNLTKEVYEAEHKNLTDREDYVSDWTIPMMLRCKEVWLAAVVPGIHYPGPSWGSLPNSCLKIIPRLDYPTVAISAMRWRWTGRNRRNSTRSATMTRSLWDLKPA